MCNNLAFHTKYCSSTHCVYVVLYSQHAEALSSLRSEMVRAQTEELRRIQKHADDERDKLQKKIDKERETLQKEREQLKDQLEKERNRLRREKEEQKEWLHKEAEEVKEHLRREKEEEVDRLRKELEVDRVRVRSQLDKSIEQVEAEKIMVQQKLEDERRRLVEKAEEDRRRLKEQVRKAIEEVMRRHAAELHGVQEALSSEKKTNQEVSMFSHTTFFFFLSSRNSVSKQVYNTHTQIYRCCQGHTVKQSGSTVKLRSISVFIDFHGCWLLQQSEQDYVAREGQCLCSSVLLRVYQKFKNRLLFSSAAHVGVVFKLCSQLDFVMSFF